MATYTENYNLAKPESSDYYNHQLYDNSNMDIIDEAMKENKSALVSKATDVFNGTVHTITRSNTDTPMFWFVADYKWDDSYTMVIDGTQVTVRTVEGTTPESEAFILGSRVLCLLDENIVTIFTNREELDGITSDISTLQTTVDTNTSNISTLQTAVASNTSNINTNTNNISTLQTNVSANTSDISTLQTNVAANTSDISTLQTNVSANTSDISELQDSLIGTIGSSTKPVYLNDSVITEGETYAGGTSITLNGVSKSGNTASLYAPITAGTSGYVLTSTGTGSSEPTWTRKLNKGVIADTLYEANFGSLETNVGSDITTFTHSFTDETIAEYAAAGFTLSASIFNTSGSFGNAYTFSIVSFTPSASPNGTHQIVFQSKALNLSNGTHTITIEFVFGIYAET